MGAKKYLRTIGLGLSGFFLLLMLTPTAAPAAAIEWKMQTIYPASDTSTPCIAEKIVNTLNDRLKGKLHITLYMPGQIVPEEGMFDALKRGVFDAAFMAPTWYQNFIPDAIVGFGLPLGWQGYDMDMEFFYKYGFLKYMRDIHAEQNVYYVCPNPFGQSTFLTNFPYRKLEDIKGKKLWCIGTTAAYLRNLGGVPVTFPISELYMALKLGTLDGTSGALSDLDANKWKEVVKYVNFPLNINPNNGAWLVNLKIWNELPPDVQKTIEDTIMELQPEMWKCIEDYGIAGVEAAKNAGVQINTMEPSEVQRLRPAALKVWQDVAKRSDRAPKTVQMLKDFLATKGIKIE
jgi:TRAP-type C4-dicarboxylate transport system substrate-binding protein